MKVIALSLDLFWKEKDKNLTQIENIIKNLEADVFVFPEMFSSGFCMDAEEISDQNNEVVEWMKKLSKNKQSAITGSIAVKENDNFFNRMYFVSEETAHLYNKRHLFSFAGEDKVYTPGNERIVVVHQGFKILLQVCYDLRFPVFSRNKGDFDVMIFVANWPESRVDAWKTLLKARAIENQCYVIGVNRTGIDGNDIQYTESSHCFFADGTDISKKEGIVVSAHLDLHTLQQFREKFPFLKDADDFTIDL